MNEMRKLMESVEQLSEEYVEYRDPDGEFQVIYDFPRGYFAVGKNDAKRDISGESFDNLDDAIEHAEICLSIGNDGYEDQYVDEQIDEISGDGEPDLRLKIEKMIVPQVEDDANPEEWIQLMIYAFDEIDQPFNVEVAEAVLADYGMTSHYDLQARFGGVDESAIEEDRFDDDVAEEKRKAVGMLASIIVADIYSAVKRRGKTELYPTSLIDHEISKVTKVLSKRVRDTYNGEDQFVGEEIEQINEISDFDGDALDALVAQFEETCKAFRIGSFPRKQLDLLKVVMSRAQDTQDLSGMGHENALGNDHQPSYKHPGDMP